jgi:uncharacterized protein (DUF2132 family)
MDKLRDPLHGVTLEMILNYLVEQYGWEEMGRMVNIKCFTNDPSIGSSLHFLRRHLWARKKVEDLYVKCFLDQYLKEQKANERKDS